MASIEGDTANLNAVRELILAAFAVHEAAA
jgi:hypothetical protein